MFFFERPWDFGKDLLVLSSAQLIPQFSSEIVDNYIRIQGKMVQNKNET